MNIKTLFSGITLAAALTTGAHAQQWKLKPPPPTLPPVYVPKPGPVYPPKPGPVYPPKPGPTIIRPRIDIVVPQQQLFNYSIAIQNSLQTPVNNTVDGTAYTTQAADTGNFWNQNYNGVGYTFTVIFEDGTGTDTWITEHVPAGAVNLAFETDDNGAIALFWD